MGNGSGSPPVSTTGAGRDMGRDGEGTAASVKEVPASVEIVAEEASSHMPGAQAREDEEPALP